VTIDDHHRSVKIGYGKKEEK